MSSVLKAEPATTSSRVARIAGMAPSGLEGKLAPAEIVEVIRAYRRGVTLKTISRSLGRADSQVRSAIGTWALMNAVLPERE